MTHANSREAYRRLKLTKSQEIVVRAIRRETIAGRPATIDSIFRQYGLMPTSTSARIGELKEMAEAGQAFELDGWSVATTTRMVPLSLLPEFTVGAVPLTKIFVGFCAATGAASNSSE